MTGPLAHPLFARTESWVFDLDNTLYDAESHVFVEVGKRMTDFVENHLKVPPAEAARLTSGSISAAASFLPERSASSRSLACSSLISSKATPAASITSIAA